MRHSYMMAPSRQVRRRTYTKLGPASLGSSDSRLPDQVRSKPAFSNARQERRLACWTATTISGDARVALPCRPDKSIDYLRAEAHTGKRYVADQVIDAHGLFVLSGWRQGGLPARVLIEQVTLDKPDWATSLFRLTNSSVGSRPSTEGP